MIDRANREIFREPDTMAGFVTGRAVGGYGGQGGWGAGAPHAGGLPPREVETW
jgi:hypothetical protein